MRKPVSKNGMGWPTNLSALEDRYVLSCLSRYSNYIPCIYLRALSFQPVNDCKCHGWSNRVAILSLCSNSRVPAAIHGLCMIYLTNIPTNVIEVIVEPNFIVFSLLSGCKVHQGRNQRWELALTWREVAAWHTLNESRPQFYLPSQCPEATKRNQRNAQEMDSADALSF